MENTLSKQWFGKAGGKDVHQYTLQNNSGMLVKILDYGGTITHLYTPGRDGQSGDVVLGYDTLEGYLGKGNPYFGCLVGRYANRIGGARFMLDGKEYRLTPNNNGNSLHGGVEGFNKKIWKVRSYQPTELVLEYKSPDGEEGFPGNLDVTVTYSITGENALHIKYEAVTDKATPVCLTNHGYFNLSAGLSPTILDHELVIKAKSFTEVDANLVPTGNHSMVGDFGEGGGGVPFFKQFDFYHSKRIGEDIDHVPGGYDHNYELDGPNGKLRFAASVYDPKTGRLMEMLTTEPGVQFFSANFGEPVTGGKGGVDYGRHCGLCLEAQHFPDSPNQTAFPSVILRPGETYLQETVYRFSVRP